LIEILREFIATPSHSHDTADFEELVASKVGEINDVRFMPVQGIGRNVVSRVVHDDSLPTVIISGHMDTVPVCEGWTREPLQATVEGDLMYGLGSADMKSGLALAVRVFRTLADLGTVNATFLGTVDEEGDCTGAFTFLDKEPEADLAILAEPTNAMVMMGCRGRLVYDILVRGRSAHGARPDRGVNAIDEACRFTLALQDLDFAEHDILGRGSACVLSMEGGTDTLSVPETCRMKLDRHYVPGETPEGITSQLLGLAEGLDSRAGFDIGLDGGRKTPFLEPYLTENEGLAAEFCGAVKAELLYGRSVGDYNAFATRMPAVVYGPTGGNWHCADEWVSLSSLDECLEGYERFAAALKNI